MRFTKMEGLGNDYVYLDCTQETPDDLPELARRMSDRHFGVGSDGLICVCPSETADFRMLMFNADGSQGAMCGNGIRCVGKYVYDKGLTQKTRLTIETGAGLRSLTLSPHGRTMEVTVEMGCPVIRRPVTLELPEGKRAVVPVSMGNPHIVRLVTAVKGLNLTEIGPRYTCHPRFPDQVNTEFVELVDRQTIRMRVWERGSGETLACGTGACAGAAVCVAQGLTDPALAVELPGGALQIEWPEPSGPMYMTGPAVTVFEGDWPEDEQRRT